VPVIDAQGKLVGMAGPAEVLAALHGAPLEQAA
jgi:CBS-domain-containing membrane protein